MIEYILQHGIDMWDDDGSLDFYLLGLGLYPTVFTNVDMDAISRHLQFTPIIRGLNDYYWTHAGERDRVCHYLVVQQA